MEITAQQLTEWKAARQQLLDDLAPLEAGQIRTSENRGAGWTDTTGDRIAQLKRTIATYEQMIERAEANDAG